MKIRVWSIPIKGPKAAERIWCVSGIQRISRMEWGRKASGKGWER